MRAATIALVLCFLPLTSRADEGEAKRLAKSTLEAAKQGLKNEESVFRAEQLFWWSQRVLFAELDLSETPEARVDAFRHHLDRCREYEDKILRLKNEGSLSNQAVVEARYFRVRAEYWLAKEKLVQARERSPGETKTPAIPVTPATFERR
jgi:hypothetical protein